MSDQVYTHSESFALLKDIKEEVSEALTTAQWLQTLDYFIESALDPIATASPDLMDNFYTKVLAFQFNKPSIKFSREDKANMPALVFNSITTVGEDKRRFQRKLLLNRGLLVGLIRLFAQTLNNFKHLHDPFFKIRRSRRMHLIQLAEKRTGIPSSILYSALRQSEFWAAKAHWFKSLIVQKYTRLALMNARRAYTDVQYRVSLDDIVQTYLMFLSKAIDRCDCRQGVLTTFIQTWFHSSKAEIVRSAESNQHTSYEELLGSALMYSASEPDSSFESLQELSHKAKMVDPEGIVRYSLGIPEFFSSKDLKKLRLFTHP